MDGETSTARGIKVLGNRYSATYKTLILILHCAYNLILFTHTEKKLNKCCT